LTGFLESSYVKLRAAVAAKDTATLPTDTSLRAGAAALSSADLSRRGPEATIDHILRDVVPALNGQNLSGRYYGFVIGSTLPVAEAADNIVSALDQNVQVHLPDQTLSTAVEDSALRMVLSLLELGPPDEWPSRTFTTGATASNLLGLACGREAVIERRLPEGSEDCTVAKVGLVAACLAAEVKQIQILTSMGHSSLSKAASIVGLGHGAVKELPASEDEPWRLDLDAVECQLRMTDVASIIVVSAGEVNTGRFATNALDMPKLRSLADRHGAWIHVDGGTYYLMIMTPLQTKPYISIPSLRYLGSDASSDRRVSLTTCHSRWSSAG
jgi:glutamate/tyrosine decarboxylase-like PLP-dependent enzyme